MTLALAVWGPLVPSSLDPGPTWACFSPLHVSQEAGSDTNCHQMVNSPAQTPPKKLKIRDTPTGKEEKNLTGSQVGKPLLALM